MTQKKRVQNIAEQVTLFLDNEFIIRKCLFQNIISLRALSRHILTHYKHSEKETDAILSAIRRYKRDHKEKEGKTKKLFSDITLKTKDGIVDMYVSKNKSMQKKMLELAQYIEFEKGDILRIIQAEQGLRIIIDEKNYQKIKQICKDEIQKEEHGLAEINMSFSLEAAQTTGILSVLTASIAAHGITIVEVMSCAPELILIVRNSDLIEVLKILTMLKTSY